MAKFKIGDIAICICKNSEKYGLLKCGKEYPVVSVQYGCIEVKDETGNTETYYENRFVLKTQEGEKEMNVEQMRDEVVRIDKRIEEANKDIENAQKEREALVEKIREKGFVLAEKKSSVSNNGERFKIGDKVVVIGNSSGHDFDDNQVVTIRRDEGHMYLCESGLESWYVNDTDITKI